MTVIIFQCVNIPEFQVSAVCEQGNSGHCCLCFPGPYTGSLQICAAQYEATSHMGLFKMKLKFIVKVSDIKNSAPRWRWLHFKCSTATRDWSLLNGDADLEAFHPRPGLYPTALRRAAAGRVQPVPAFQQPACWKWFLQIISRHKKIIWNSNFSVLKSCFIGTQTCSCIIWGLLPPPPNDGKAGSLPRRPHGLQDLQNPL